MSDTASSNTLEQRFVPRDRESFFDAQRRNRRATWRLSVVCVLAILVMGIPLALTTTPLLYAVILIVADIINYFSPLPSAFWHQANEVARFGFVALGWLLDHKPADPQALAIGAAVMLLPGVLLSVVLWLGTNALLKHGGIGGALLALNAREPDQNQIEELRLADVVQEMAIAAGLPAPRVMLVDGPGANAAAIGTSPADARIIVSRRMIDELSRDELEGALAHLIASIGNGDLRIAFRVAAIFETCGLLVALINSPFGSQSRRTLWRILRYGLGGSAKNGGGQEAAAVAEILTRSVTLESDDIDQFFDTTKKKSIFRSIRNFLFFPIFFTNFAIKLSLWFFSSAMLAPSIALLWRTRKYLADASAVQLTRDPDSLAHALQKLNEDGGAVPGGSWAAHLFIVTPKDGNRASSAGPSPRQQELLAQAWISSGQSSGTTVAAQSGSADFPSLVKEFMTVQRSAAGGDAQAQARIRAMTQLLAALDPALAGAIPDPADLAAARSGDRAAMVRLQRASRQFKSQANPQGAAPQGSAGDAAQSSDVTSLSFLSFHPPLKRRLKRLDRMGAHVEIAAADRKAWIVEAVIGMIFAPFLLLIVAMLLLLISILTLTSLTFLVIWLAFIHTLFALVAHP